MANVGPGTVTITETTGPGQSVTALKQTDVASFELDFMRNTIKITRTGAGGINYYDLSALATLTLAISGGVIAVTCST